MSCHVLLLCFCFCWAGLALLAQASSALCFESNQTHTHWTGAPRANQCGILSPPPNATIVSKRCSVAGTSGWHRHHTEAPDSPQICLKQVRAMLPWLYRPIGSVVAVPSMAFPDGNTCPPPSSPFRNIWAAVVICPRPNLERIGRQLSRGNLSCRPCCCCCYLMQLRATGPPSGSIPKAACSLPSSQ